MDHVKVKAERTFKTATTIALIVAAASLIYVFSTIHLVQDGLYYRQEILNKDLLPYWQQIAQ